MALYAYVKKKNKQSFLSHLPSPTSSKLARHVNSAKAKVPQKALFIVSCTFFLAGIFLVGQVAYPILGWYLFVLPGYQAGIASPLATNFQPENSPLYPALVKADEAISGTSPEDSFKASTWFVGARADQVNSGLKIYTISIPKLKIDSASVKIGGEDLKKSLIAWPTSAPPGNPGNNIIFGHSELPQFASPTNYSGIFTHLMDLEIGDEILVDYDGIRYRYTVSDKSVISPTDLSVLEQRFDSSYITLITCLPPGTVWKRGVVKGTLTQF